MATTNKPVALIILDGWGYRKETEDNPIAKAHTPFFDYLWQHHPHTLLEASGEHVGLPAGQMGNSEVGHTTIGAGKVMETDLVRISKAALREEFDNNPAMTALFEHVKQHGSTLHIKGLIGPGGVHSHSEHLYAFLRAAKKAGVNKIAVHAFTDGRDTPPQSAAEYLEELEQVIEQLGIGLIATASGRFFAMDRDNNWDRLAKAEQAIFYGRGNVLQSQKPSAAIRELYKQSVTDEHIQPIVFLDDNGKSYNICSNDGVFIFNFRSDRVRMLGRKTVERNKTHNLCVVTMTEYDPTLECLVAFPPLTIETTLAAEVERAGLTQVHIAETEKFAHATYFLNGGREKPHRNEIHVLIDSRKDIDTHDKAPRMRAEAVAKEAIDYIINGTDFIFINFANPDMVGHTANEAAVIEAIEEVDTQLGKVIGAIQDMGGIALITADHGNAEYSIDPSTGDKHTAHSNSPVPAIVVGIQAKLRPGALHDIAPTILSLLDIPKPSAMTGNNLIS